MKETIAGKFDIDTSDKSVLRKIGEKSAEGIGEGLAGGTVNTVWDVGEAVFDNDSSTTVTSALKQSAKETVREVAGSSANAVVSEGISSGVDNMDSKAGKAVAETLKDTVADTAENMMKGITGRTMDYVYGDEKDTEKIFGDIWEEDLESGRSIVRSVGESVGEQISDAVHKDDELSVDLKKLDKDGDGNIEVVQFDDYAFTKQD